jgi:hypothetical protein
VSAQQRVIKIWQRLTAVAGGRWLFARLVCRKAP